MGITIRSFRPEDTEAVVALWRDGGLTRPWNDPYRDIDRKLTTQPELFLVAEGDGVVVGTAMIGWDGHRGWISYLTTATSHRGRGIARALISRAESELTDRGCPKIMLMVRADNTAVVDFYTDQGYAIDNVAVLGKRLIPDD